MSNDAIQSAEQRCLRLVTIAENQAKEEQRILRAEVRRLEAELLEKEQLAVKGSKEGVRALQQFKRGLEDAINLFISKNEEFHTSVVHIAEQRKETEALCISHLKDTVSSFYKRLREERRNNFIGVVESTNLGIANVEKDADLPFSVTEPIGLYLRGAMQALHLQADRINTHSHAYLSQVETLRRKVLTDPERKIFQKTIRQLASPFVAEGWEGQSFGGESSPMDPARGSTADLASSRRQLSSAQVGTSLDIVSPQAFSVILLQRLCDDRESRYANCVELMKGALKAQGKQFENAIQAVVQQMKGNVQRLTMSRLDEVWRLGPDQPAPKSPSKWRALKGSFALASSQSQQRESEQQQQQQGEVAAVAAGSSGGGGVREFVYVVNQLEDRLMSKLVDQHVEEYAKVSGEFSFRYDQLARKADAEREVQIYQTTTTFSLETLQSEMDHRELLGRVLQQQHEATATKHTQEVQQLENSVADLQAAMVILRRENTELRNVLEEKDREIESLQSVCTQRLESMNLQGSLRSDMKKLEYQLNPNTFCGTWQESLLLLRQRLLSEIQNDNNRFIARVNTIIKRHASHDGNLEHLYETRIRSATKEVEEDNARKAERTAARHRKEIQHLCDHWQRMLEDEKTRHAEQLEMMRKIYADEYDTKVRQLNEMYDEKVRKMERHREEREAFFSSKVTQMREVLRERENDLEVRAAKRFAEMNQHFEGLSDDLRNRYLEREKALDREKLLVHANFEKNVNERAIQIRGDFDKMGHRLQTMVIQHLNDQRGLFESFREKELATFAAFSQQTKAFVDEKYSENRTEEVRLHGEAISSIQGLHLGELEQQRTELASIDRIREENFRQRIDDIKANSEEVLRCTQEVRIEQDEKFWNECHNELIAANHLLIEEQTRLETLLQSRYASLVDRCDQYLQSDLQAAREAFEAEHKQRCKFLHSYCDYYHLIQLELEQTIWEELATRKYIVKEYISEMFSIRVIRAEEKRNVQFCDMLDENPFVPVGVIRLDELRTIREDYESRLMDKQRLVASITRDSLAALESQMRAQNHQYIQSNDMFEQRLVELVNVIQEKFHTYFNSRSFVVDRELSRIVHVAESIVASCLREQGGSKAPKPAAGMVATHSGTLSSALIQMGSADGKENTPPDQLEDLAVNSTGADGDTATGGAHWSEEVRVMEYFVGMKQVLTRAMEEYEDKLEARFGQDERRRNAAFQKMHLEYLQASGSLMKQLEALKMTNDQAEISLQQAKTKLALQSSEQNKAKMLCDDLLSLLQSHLPWRAQQRPTGGGDPFGRKTGKPGGGRGGSITAGLSATSSLIPIPLGTISDLAALRERIYSDEYSRFARGKVFPSSTVEELTEQ